MPKKLLKEEKRKGRDERERAKETYPIMTSDHEVVSPIGSVPKGVSARHQVHVISDVTPQGVLVVRVWLEEVLHHPCHAEGHEVGVRGFAVQGPEPPALAVLHFFDEPALACVYVLAWSCVGDGKVSFSVHVHLESPLHFHVASVEVID